MKREPFEPLADENIAAISARGWYVCDAAWPTDAMAAVAALGRQEEVAWLDSAGSAQPDHERQCSMICMAPLMVLEQFDGHEATLSAGRRGLARDSNGWRLWRRAMRELAKARPCSANRCAFGLAPGWVGYIGFEMGRFLERLPNSHQEELGLPLMRLALFDRAIVLDHSARRAYAVAAPALRTALNLGADDFREWFRQWESVADARACPGRGSTAAAEVRFESSRGAHVQAVERALRYIGAGDIYQVNLAHRLSLRGADPLSAYAAIRTSNPAPYAALLRWQDGAIASASPELFLRVRGDAVLTRPIKGTRPRGQCSADDERRWRELLESEKEAAELAMIIDLHRNDLGRVCAFGSVLVQAPRRLETHPSVFHTVADVTGRLVPGRDALDLLQACFPAGSVTGVPKIRAMQIIDELEPAARGAYTGAIGVLTLDGQMSFNVAIRTLQMRGERALLHVGGGVVADSDPEAEYEETLAKARGILDGLLNQTPNKRRMATHAAGNGLH
jgi:para-aminobenzoate synthetase component 1